MRNRLRILRFAAVVFAAGTCLQVGTCISYVSQLNPCGSVLNCDPVTYRFVRSGYEGPGAYPDIDPACTFPPFCDGDPFVEDLTAGGGG